MYVVNHEFNDAVVGFGFYPTPATICSIVYGLWSMLNNDSG